jgi:membrane protein YqaA with SNARE-associated domain
VEPAVEVVETAPSNHRALILRTLLGFGVAFGAAALAGRLFRPQIEALGRAFVANFGYAGMYLGTFLADAFTLPLPSWFYFVLTVASGASPLFAIVAVTLGSLTGALLAYRMSASIAEVPLFSARIAAAREKLAPLLEKYGAWAMLIVSFLPLPFSITCYVAGSYRIGPRLFGIYLALRVPRLIAFYLIVRAGFA